MSTAEYAEWQKDPTPDNMAKVVDSLTPLVNSEVQRYTGPKPLLRSKAKQLAVTAIKTYKPDSGAKLQSWVVTQLQPLSRYSGKLRTVHASEAMLRQSAELNTRRKSLADELGYMPTDEELADHVGISVAKIRQLKSTVPATISESSVMDVSEGDDQAVLPGVTTPNRLGSIEEIVYGSLSPRDQSIFDMKTGKHGAGILTNYEIAKRLGVTPALVSQRSKEIAGQIGKVHSDKLL